MSDQPRDDETPRDPTSRNLTRRSLLTGGAGAVLGAAAVGGLSLLGGRGAGAPSSTTTPGEADATPVAAMGDHQAGVAAPAVPPVNAEIGVFDAPDITGPAALRDLLATLGDRIVQLTAADHRSRLLPDGPGDLTLTVGIGARLLSFVGTDLATAATLPTFAGDADLESSGGDVLLVAAASDPSIPPGALSALADGLEARWQQPAFRGARKGGATRNPFGYYDGIIAPHTESDLDAGVWIADGPLAGGTICTVRRFRLDIARFQALGDGAQDAVFGRRQSDGQPLSGGDAFGEIDLTAKSAEGEYLVPARAHARAAHPSFIGAPLMLRRSYSYANAADDRGIVFLSFQNDVSTFARTLRRMEEVDDLLPFTTATASGAFAVLPGFSSDRPLGATLSV
ncbi:MAG: peroxidase [Microbacterium sp.]|nr:MAG: peroxidase [Microbacterium sp.]